MYFNTRPCDNYEVHKAYTCHVFCASASFEGVKGVKLSKPMDKEVSLIVLLNLIQSNFIEAITKGIRIEGQTFSIFDFVGWGERLVCQFLFLFNL